MRWTSRARLLVAGRRRASVWLLTSIPPLGVLACSGRDDPGATATSASRTQALVSSQVSCGDVSGLAASPWPMRGACPGHVSRASVAGPQNKRLLWSLSLGGNVQSSPAIGVDGTIYVGADDNRLHAIRPDGHKVWSHATGGDVNSSPAVGADGTIYVGSNDEYLYAINPDGSRKWRYKTGGEIYSSPLVGADGTVYVGSDDNRVHAVRPDGTLKWKTATGGDVRSSPATSRDGATIYVGSDDDKLYAISASNGDVQWATNLGSRDVRSSPAIGDDGRIYVGSDRDKLYALSVAGAVLWTVDTSGDVQSSPAIGPDGTVYVGSDDGKLRAISPSGDVLWQFPTGAEIDASPVVDAAGNVYFGSDDDSFYAVNSSGTLLWKANLGDRDVESTAAISGHGTVYVGSDANRLYAFGTTPSTSNLQACYASVIVPTTGPNLETSLQWALCAGGGDVEFCKAAFAAAVNFDLRQASNLFIVGDMSIEMHLALTRDRSLKAQVLATSDPTWIGAFCAGDVDEDLVPDDRDSCPDTAPLTPTRRDGCDLPAAAMPTDVPDETLVRYMLQRSVYMVDPTCDRDVLPKRATARDDDGACIRPSGAGWVLIIEDQNSVDPPCNLVYEIQARIETPSGTRYFAVAVPRAQALSVSEGVGGGAFVTLPISASAQGDMGVWGSLGVTDLVLPPRVTLNVRVVDGLGRRSQYSRVSTQVFGCSP
jgi:outer membrane protein assembly factor BamB